MTAGTTPASDRSNQLASIRQSLHRWACMPVQCSPREILALRVLGWLMIAIGAIGAILSPPNLLRNLPVTDLVTLLVAMALLLTMGAAALAMARRHARARVAAAPEQVTTR